MKADRYLEVLYKGRVAGTLALTPEKKAAFEYADEWLKDGFSISPFSLPLKKQVFIPQKDYFHGLFGVFADSLPDTWGNILLDRILKKNGINADQMDILDRLAIVALESSPGSHVWAPESFEYLILRSGIVQAEGLREIMQAPGEFIESGKYSSWERFFTRLLEDLTKNTVYAYSKRKLNPNYITKGNIEKIVKMFPEQA